MERFVRAMADCSDFQIEAGGHTDSQGSEAFNAELSRSRAQAIVSAMADAGISVANMSARGYGESRPVATNQTEEGREINRRIEFRLLSPHPLDADSIPAPVTIAGVTGAEVDPDPAEDLTQGPRLPPMQGPQLPDRAAQMQGPQLPHSRAASGMVPMTVGVAEQFQTLDEREENLRVPVLTPDDDTPRPARVPTASQSRQARKTKRQTNEQIRIHSRDRPDSVRGLRAGLDRQLAGPSRRPPCPCRHVRAGPHGPAAARGRGGARRGRGRPGRTPRRR